MASFVPTPTADESLKALREAASSLKPEDFITYTTIADAHLTNGLTKFNSSDREKLVNGFQEILLDFEELATNVAWDLIPVLLPFVTHKPATSSHEPGASSDVKPTEDRTKAAVKELMRYLTKIGNPREVFLVITGKLSSMDFHGQRAVMEGGETDVKIKVGDENGSEASFDADDEPLERLGPESDYIADQALLLLELLAIVQSRIQTKKLSRFLTSSLTSILGMFSRASQSFSAKKNAEILSLVDKYFDTVVPMEKVEQEEEEEDAPVCSKLQEAFATHLVEEFLSGSGDDARTARFASRYYKTVQPKKIVPGPQGGEGGVFGEIKQQHGPDEPVESQEEIDAVLFSVSLLADLSEKLNITASHLLGATMIPDLSSDSNERPVTPETPKFAADISLSPRGSLLLLAAKILRTPDDASHLTELKIFPQHAQLSSLHLQGDPPASIVDALLFLGSWILRRKSNTQAADSKASADLPNNDDKFLLYIQKYAAISATSPDPAIRFLAHTHVADILNRHPREEVRLAYIRDTLEHCPFEALKAAVIGILKDEVVAALRADASDHSIFLSPVLLESLHEFLFPDYSEDFPGKDFKMEWPKFMELYSTITTTANFYYLILANEILRQKLGIYEGGKVEEAQQRWTNVIKNAESAFRKNLDAGVEGLDQEDVAPAKLDLDMMAYTFERLQEERKKMG